MNYCRPRWRRKGPGDDDSGARTRGFLRGHVARPTFFYFPRKNHGRALTITLDRWTGCFGNENPAWPSWNVEFISRGNRWKCFEPNEEFVRLHASDTWDHNRSRKREIQALQWRKKRNESSSFVRAFLKNSKFERRARQRRRILPLFQLFKLDRFYKKKRSDGEQTQQSHFIFK